MTDQDRRGKDEKRCSVYAALTAHDTDGAISFRREDWVVGLNTSGET